MDNLETLATLSTQDTGQRQTKTPPKKHNRKTKKMRNTDPQKTGVNADAREG